VRITTHPPLHCPSMDFLILTLPVFFGDAGGKSSHQICESEWDQQPPAIRAELVETKSSRLRPVIGLRSYCIRQIGSLKAATGMPTGEKGCQSSPGESGRRLSPVRFGSDNWVIAAISPYFSPDYRSFSTLQTVWRRTQSRANSSPGNPCKQGKIQGIKCFGPQFRSSGAAIKP
jgi:hypothetical protein